jgi:putative ABC transport system permease protein
MNGYFIRQILRAIYRKKFNSLVKIVGITLAIIPAMLIWSFVQQERSYDRNFPGYEKIFRIIRNWQEDKKFGVYTSVPFFPALLQNFPEIETGTRIWPLYGQDAIVCGTIYNKDVMLAADSSFFPTFRMELVAGDKSTALHNPGSVIISKSIAANLFGKEDPVGKVIEFEGSRFSEQNRLFSVQGVYEDFPTNSHFKCNFILSLQSFITYRNSNPTNHMLMTYIRLKNPYNEKTVEEKLPKFMESFYGKQYYDYARSTYLLQPLTDIHLNTNVNYNEYETTKGSYSSIYIFPSLVLLIIIVSCLNFINLTVSEGVSRHKAFGINKIWGAGKYFYFRTYIIESLILTFVALIVALFFLDLISPIFNDFVERDLDLKFYNNPYWMGATLIFALLIGIINGIYPANLYSSKKMVDYLKEKADPSVKQYYIQRVFQISQFAICIFLIFGSFVVFRQLRYINTTINQSLKSNQVLVIKNADKLGPKQEVFKSELKKTNGIRNVSVCREVPGVADYSHWGLPVDSAAFNTHVAVFYCDYDYLSTLDMQIVKGRFFDPEFSTDNNAVVLNETAVKTLGWEDGPLGKRYRLDDTFRVIGVVKDIHFTSFHHEIIPQGFFPVSPNNVRRILVKIESGMVPEALQNIRQLWTKLVSDRDIHYNFLDEDFNSWYKNERKTGQLAIVLTIIAIFLSGLGFLSLVLLSIHNRTKEIGIRKVNGAKIREVIFLLNAKYIKLIMAAFLIASPVSWYAMHKWLQNFAYQTTISWWIFALSGLITLVIALLTVSWQSWRAATRNPVEALRYE